MLPFDLTDAWQPVPLHILTGFGLVSPDGVILVVTMLVVALVIAANRIQPALHADEQPNQDELLQALIRSTAPVTSNARVTIRPIPLLAQENAASAILISTAAPKHNAPTVLPFPPGETAPDTHRIAFIRNWIAILARVSTNRRLRSVPVSAAGLAIGLFLVYAGQKRLLDNPVTTGAYVLWFLGLLFVLILNHWADQPGGVVDTSRGAAGASPIVWTKPRLIAIGFLGIASVFIWTDGKHRAADDSSLDLVALWLGSMTAIVIAAAGPPRREHFGRLLNWLRRSRRDVLITAGIVIVALIPRLYDLSGNPWAMSGDEGIFGNTARESLNGGMTNPFFSGAKGYPSFFFVLEGQVIRLFGDSVGSARLPSALLGACSVVAIYWLARHYFGQLTALTSAAIASTFHFHIFWSRNAMPGVATMFFFPMAILFLDRGLGGRRRMDSLAAGLIIGLSQFFHAGNRMLFPITAVYAGYALLHGSMSSRRSLSRSAKTLAPNLIWAVLGIIIGHLPLLAYFSTHRAAFSDRTNQVSLIKSGWLEQQQDITGKSVFAILLDQFEHAALLPFNTIPGGVFFHNSPPFVGWPLVMPVAIGLAIATTAFWRGRFFGLVLGFWATVAGLAWTLGAPETNRFTAAAPFLVIFAAIGIVSVARIMIQLIRLPSSVVIPVASGLVLFIAAWYFNFTFRDPNQYEIYSDPNTQIAYTLALQAETLGAEATVYLSGMPRLSYHGFPNIEYVAPDAVGIDIGEDEAWSSGDTPPALTGPTLFAFIPDRLDELEVVRSWFPGGIVEEHALSNGDALYVSYLVDAPLTRGDGDFESPDL